MQIFSLFAGLAVSVLVLLGVATPFYNNSHSKNEGASRAMLFASGAPKKELRPDTLPREPEINAHAFLVRLVGETTPLLARRPFKALPPASLTKILTAVIALEEIAQDAVIPISASAKAVGEKQSRAMIGESFRRDAMLAWLMVESANDAAYAIAEYIGVGAFVNRMNQKIEALGIKNAVFENPMGFDREGHKASAEAIGLIVEYAWFVHPHLWEITREIAPTVTAESGVAYTLSNTNELLKEFPALRGGKTGYTDEARGTLVLLYPVRPNRAAIIVILGSEDRFGDGRKLIQWLEEAF